MASGTSHQRDLRFGACRDERMDHMEDITLDDVIELLTEVKEDVDYSTETALVDDRVLDSFDILAVISSIDEEFDISVPAKYIQPVNFNSAQAILAMLQKIQEEEDD